MPPWVAVLLWPSTRRGADYVDTVYRAVWAGEQNLADSTVFAGLLGQAGFDGSSLLRQALGGEYVARLDRQTSEAAERGVFGSPTFFVHDQMFFGNDRLDFVIEAANAAT